MFLVEILPDLEVKIKPNENKEVIYGRIVGSFEHFTFELQIKML